MDFVESLSILALVVRSRARKRRQKRQQKRQYSPTPDLSHSKTVTKFEQVHQDLCSRPYDFFKFYGMSQASFEYLLRIIGPKITKMDTSMKKAIPAKVRLSVTLKSLASGLSFRTLAVVYEMGDCTIGKIVKATCEQLWEGLQPIYMPENNEEDWKEIAEQFSQKTNFPNCIGAVSGRHISFCRKSNAKRTPDDDINCSMVLHGIADAQYCFTAINVEPYSPTEYSDTFENSNLAHTLLNIPPEQPLRSDINRKPMPFIFVGQKAFALSKHVLRPYSKKNATIAQRVFNHRLSRAHKTVRYAFNLLTNKWRIFDKPFVVKSPFADSILKSCCVLHNFVRKQERLQMVDESYRCPLNAVSSTVKRGDEIGMNIRDYFTNYFNSTDGLINSQLETIMKTEDE